MPKPPEDPKKPKPRPGAGGLVTGPEGPGYLPRVPYRDPEASVDKTPVDVSRVEPHEPSKDLSVEPDVRSDRDEDERLNEAGGIVTIKHDWPRILSDQVSVAPGKLPPWQPQPAFMTPPESDDDE